MERYATAVTHPSLALIKYWGKQKKGYNIPASTSLAVSLGGLDTETRVYPSQQDEVFLDGVLQSSPRFPFFFEQLRKHLKTDMFFRVQSSNNFPTSAGLASSSSGFAALTLAAAGLADRLPDAHRLSALARLGSASAARSVFGGFVLFPAGAKAAQQIYPADYWPEFRILVAVIQEGEKGISSREAMKRSRESSPFYNSWLKDSRVLLNTALEGLQGKDMEKMGDAVVASYLRMHAVMMASDPPVRYWFPGSVAVMKACEELRNAGIGAWETMDAGPQVKIMCLEKDVKSIESHLKEIIPDLPILETKPGEGPRLVITEERTQIDAEETAGAVFALQGI